MTLDQILPQLENVKQRGDSYTARCPAHDDVENSLSLTSENGELLLHCFANCTFKQILAALPATAPNGQPKSKPKDNNKLRFTYTDAEVTKLCEELLEKMDWTGEVADFLRARGISRTTSLALRLGATHRTFPKVGGSPAVAIPLYHGNKLVGVKYRAVIGKDFLTETGSNMSGLYGRPDPTAKEILLLEGPLDAALAMSHGFNTVGIQAADTAPTKPDLKLLGQYPSIFIIGDSDRAGREAMTRWQTELSADYTEALIRVNLGGYKDIGDLYAADPPGFCTALKTILRRARAGREYFDPDDLLTETELRGGNVKERHAVELLVPRRQISMFYGEEKSGKTLLAFYFGKCVSNELSVFGKYPTAQMPVLYLDLENPHSELEANAKWFARLGPVPIRFRTRETGVPLLDSPGLLRYCEKHEPLLILDSQTKFVKRYFEARGGKGSQFDPDDMSGFYDQLLDLCAAGATVIIIHHATRADGERYSSSHQIGANVSRAFAIISEDRPQLNRVRFQGVLFRGAAPLTEQLIGFPVISEQGCFGLSDAPALTLEDRIVEQVKKYPQGVSRTELAKKVRGRKETIVDTVRLLLTQKKLVQDRKLLFVPEPGTAYQTDFVPEREQDGNSA